MTPPRRTFPSIEVRIAQRITSDGSAIIPPRIARWLEDKAGVTADRRIRLRDNDPDAYVALAALHLAALRSDSGTKDRVQQRHRQESDVCGGWMSTGEAAEVLGVTDRCIRKWCKTGRLHAVLTGSRWLINPHSIALQNIA